MSKSPWKLIGTGRPRLTISAYIVWQMHKGTESSVHKEQEKPDFAVHRELFVEDFLNCFFLKENDKVKQSPGVKLFARGQ